MLNRIPKVFLLLSGIFLTMQIIGFLMMFENKKISSTSINDDDVEESATLLTTRKINSLGLK